MPSFAEKRYSFKSFKQQTSEQIAVKFTTGYLGHSHKLFTLENGKKLMLKISTICWILQEFLQRFIPIGLKWESYGFDYLLKVSLQEAMII